MYIDKRLEFCDALAITASGAATNVIDLGQDRDVGPGAPSWVVISVDVAAPSDGNQTYQFNLLTGPTTTPTTVIATVTATPADMAAGKRYVMAVPYNNQRYLGLNAVITGTTGTAESVTYSAWLTNQEPASWQASPSST